MATFKPECAGDSTSNTTVFRLGVTIVAFVSVIPEIRKKLAADGVAFQKRCQPVASRLERDGRGRSARGHNERGTDEPLAEHPHSARHVL